MPTRDPTPGPESAATSGAVHVVVVVDPVKYETCTGSRLVESELQDHSPEVQERPHQHTTSQQESAGGMSGDGTTRIDVPDFTAIRIPTLTSDSNIC
jgi:hypothetical protein